MLPLPLVLQSVHARLHALLWNLPTHFCSKPLESTTFTRFIYQQFSFFVFNSTHLGLVSYFLLLPLSFFLLVAFQYFFLLISLAQIRISLRSCPFSTFSSDQSRLNNFLLFEVAWQFSLTIFLPSVIPSLFSSSSRTISFTLDHYLPFSLL